MNKKTIGILAVILSFFFLFSSSRAQVSDSAGMITPVDSVQERLLKIIENSDLGYLWKGELSQENRLGYIGDNFQRIQVRFLSVIQNFDNPYEYFLYGKTKVRDNICEFQGSLRITETGYFIDPSSPEFLKATLSGDFVLFEDQSCLHSGIFRGDFVTAVYIDKAGYVYYDDLDSEANNYTNNEFYGEWEGYDPYELKICNWGDYRIPFSAELDMGLDTFKPSFKYLDNGWAEYLKEREKVGRGEELEKWWEF